MRVPIASAVSVAVLVAAGTAGAGTSTALAARNCGTLSAAGKTWQIGAAGISCADARAVVRKLAPQAVRPGASHGSDLGLSCFLSTGSGKSGILCAGAQGRKSVEAIGR